MPNKTMTIREMSAHFGVTPGTLRCYEAKKLLHPKRSGQHRLFSKREQVRLTLIMRGKRFGFSLEDIRQLLNLYELNGQQKTQEKQTYRLAQLPLKIMESQRAELDDTIADFKTQLAQARSHPILVNIDRNEKHN